VIRIFGTTKLIQDINGQVVTTCEKLSYLIAFNILIVITNYFPIFLAATKNVYLYVEFSIIFFITIVGIKYSYSLLREKERYIEYFICLSVPILVKISLIVGGIYYGVLWFSYEYLSEMLNPDLMTDIITMASVTILNILYYLILSKSMSSIIIESRK